MAYVKLKCDTFNPSPKPEKTTKDKKVKIKPLSDKRGKENKTYLIFRNSFIAGKKCAKCGKLSTDVHHMKGRTGKLLLDMKFWLAVCRPCHLEIEANPIWAKENGYSINRL